MARASNAIAAFEEEDDETAMFVRPSDMTRVYTAGELRAILADTVDSSVVMLVPAPRKSDHPLVFEKRSCTLVDEVVEESEPPTMERPAPVSRITLIPLESRSEFPRARFALALGAILAAAAALVGVTAAALVQFC